MDLVNLPAWNLHQAAVVAPTRDLCCEHTGAAARCPLLGFLLLPTPAAKPLSLFGVRPCCHHLPLLSLSPAPGPRLGHSCRDPLRVSPPTAFPNSLPRELYKLLSWHKASADPKPPLEHSRCPIYLPQSPCPQQRRVCSQQMKIIPRTFV